ncbi:hypothetical protein GCM10011344_25370 [Dokdonia pacifica]|uniref:DUF434 domain-containing protein n=1 Tax=Dokdonia pacifica TaxID=1627892 RepID=A0A238WS79_9FLAO|nr:DUF434 domain-containing protein [Dokdonia pacifica]GGG23545.1 hypothetical protein GCM10011344_25370 [Dokdonia pacifica]SNR49094.1 hypothetical protein SAMN06265376_1011392 [Dokdonia pacifica]
MTTRNRGKEGRDDLLFGDPKMQYNIKEAVTDISYLLSRGFSEKSSVQLVGHRYRLNARQQKAVQGMSAATKQVIHRKTTRVFINQLKDQTLVIDAFNILIILESFFSGAYVFKGLDDCYRDVSSVHGTYKRVQQTQEVLIAVGDFLKEAQVKEVIWVFDQPVSNSGRMKMLLGELSRKRNYAWQCILEYNPDKILAESTHIVASSDAWILDRAQRWFNLSGAIIETSQTEKTGTILLSN